MDLLMMKQNISPVYYKMYAGVCFFLAGIFLWFRFWSDVFFVAKSIELDERIPFIPRLKRKCEIRQSQSQIQHAEIKALEACGWNPLFTTVLEVLEYYLT